jgi:predicted ABC-type ATPase
VALVDTVAIFNNSSATGPKLILELEDGVIVGNALNSAELFDQRIAAAVAGGLDLPIGSL